MDMNRLTLKSQEAMHEAQNRAVQYGHVEVDAEHLLDALLNQEQGLVPRLIERMDVPLEPLMLAVDRELKRRPRQSSQGTAMSAMNCISTRW